MHHGRKAFANNAHVHRYTAPPSDPRVLIEELRVKRGFASLRALAIAAGVPQPTLQRYMTHKTESMEVSSLLAIANALGVTLSELLGEVPLSSGGVVRDLHRLATELTGGQLEQLLQIGRLLRSKS